MLCFWTTRGAAIFDLWMTLELLLSGRLVPLPLMPDWVQTISWFLPFQWAFFFPIESLVGDLSNAELGARARVPAALDPHRARALQGRVAVRDQALLGGRRLGVNALRVSWLYLRVGVMNELQYRVNFLVSLLQSAITLAVALAVLALVYSHTDELNGWTKSELLCVTRHPDLHGRRREDVHPAEHESRHGRGAPGDPRLCADEARGRAGARERARDPHLAGGRHRLRARRAGLRALGDRDGRRTGRRAGLCRRSRLRRGAHLLLLARDRDRRVLGREHVDRRRALRRCLRDRPLPGRHLSGLAALQRDLPRPRRVRRHRARGGGDVAARLGDAALRRDLRGGRLRRDALVLAASACVATPAPRRRP